MVEEEKIALELSHAEALVLFDFVSRYSREKQLTMVDQAEQRVLWDVCGRLEQSLAEPLMHNYAELLEIARAQVRDKE